MAAIDKIYGTKQQCEEFRGWSKVNNPGILRYFYDWNDNHVCKITGKQAITNFPEHVDMWLLKCCSLEWVTDEIKDQYGIDLV